MNRAELKYNAKMQIKGKIGILFLIDLIILGIGVLCSLVPVVGSLASTFVVVPAFSIALVKIYLGIAQGTHPQIGDLFKEFNRFWDAFKVTFLVGLFTALWSILFVIPGIIKGISYSQAMFIMAENPGMGAREAISRSKAMMEGRKMDYFVLQLSFLGWILLGSLTLGIAYIWVIPYMSATQTNFYNAIKNEPIVAEA